MEYINLGLNSGSPAYYLCDVGPVTSLSKLYCPNLQKVDGISLIGFFKWELNVITCIMFSKFAGIYAIEEKVYKHTIYQGDSGWFCVLLSISARSPNSVTRP